MQRGAATRGKVARQVAGAEAIEIKATIPDHQIEAALKRFGLTSRNDEERYIYFFDTPELGLVKAGIILRARRVVGDAHDSTVKFRPVAPEDSFSCSWRSFISGVTGRGAAAAVDSSCLGKRSQRMLVLPVRKRC